MAGEAPLFRSMRPDLAACSQSLTDFGMCLGSGRANTACKWHRNTSAILLSRSVVQHTCTGALLALQQLSPHLAQLQLLIGEQAECAGVGM